MLRFGNKSAKRVNIATEASQLQVDGGVRFGGFGWSRIRKYLDGIPIQQRDDHGIHSHTPESSRSYASHILGLNHLGDRN